MKSLCMITVMVSALSLWGVLSLRPDPVSGANLTHTCQMCHSQHRAAGGNLMRGKNVQGLCMMCHGPGGDSVLRADSHARAVNLNQPTPRVCTECHPAHGSMQAAPTFVPLTPGLKTPGTDHRPLESRLFSRQIFGGFGPGGSP